MKIQLAPHLVTALFSVAVAAQLHARTTAFTYQGQLMENGQPANGTYDLVFSLYDKPTNGQFLVLYSPGSSFSISNGLFTAQLDFGQDVFTGQPLWLQIEAKATSNITSVALSPRQLLTPAPYAIHALTVDASGLRGTIPSTNLAAGSVDNSVLANNSVDSLKIVNGTILPADVDAASFNGTFWKADGNAGTTPGGNFVGTTDFQPLEVKVGGSRAARLEPTTDVDAGSLDQGEWGYSNAVNVVLGSVHNSVALGVQGATIGGGGGFRYFNDSVSVSGFKQANLIASDMGTISGGARNRIEQNATYTVIGGGEGNTIQTNASYASIGGGYLNQIGPDATHANIDGGSANTISTNANLATIGGGGGNAVQSDADYASIGGGSFNAANGSYTVVGGGRINEASSRGATVSGGEANIASGFRATVGGGVANTVSGEYSVIPGGGNNEATGNYSFAGGRRAKANHDGCFVWADNINADLASTGPNQFLVRATGGASIGSQAGQTARLSLGSSGSPAWEMAVPSAAEPALQFSHGGSTAMSVDYFGNVTATAFNPASDRNSKENFEPVQPSDILNRVLSLPISRWNFKQQTQVTHVGPMAQDFHAAFDVGIDGRHIATVDADGVALAAIQGLNQKLERENAELKARLETLEQLVHSLNR